MEQPVQSSGFDRFCDRVGNPPLINSRLRRLFLALIIAFSIFIVIDLTRWTDGHGLDGSQFVRQLGMLLLTTHWYSRDRQVRLVSWFVGMPLLLFGLFYGLAQLFGLR
jgi:hypothetical protein